MAFEYITRETTFTEWKKELLFQEIYNQPENELDEAAILNSVDQKLFTGDYKLNTGVQSQERSNSDNEAAPAKTPKTMKLSANMYTVCYCSFMKKNKEKYRLKTHD